MLDENVDGKPMLLVLLVDREGLFVQLVLRRNLGDLVRIVVLEFADVADNFALVGANGGQQQEVLQVTVVTEGGRLDDDFLQQLDQLNWQIGLNEGLDCDGNIIWVRAFRERGGNDLLRSIFRLCVDGEGVILPDQ